MIAPAATGTSAFRPLPRPRDAEGGPRRTGVEIEFAGLTEQQTADLALARLGGRIKSAQAHRITLENTAIGELEIVLDTALRKLGDNALLSAGLDAVRGLVPIEIVTEPLDLVDLARLDTFREALREAGAIGTEDGLFLGFGVHLNVAVIAPEHPFTGATILAYGLMEDWLRAHGPIDLTRRVMPFVDPWPRRFLDALVAAGPRAGFGEVRDLYARDCNSRNFALDLLPIYKHADPATFDRLFPGQTNTKGRPAFHYRLPDCRIDDPNWTLASEWQRWWLVEALADRADLLTALAADYEARETPLIENRETWAETVAERIGWDGEELLR